MKDKPNYFERIDEFLLGHLGEEEINDFRQAVKSDEHLAKAVAKQRLLLKGITLGGRRKLKRHLKNVHQQAISSPAAKVPVRKLNWAWSIAAASVLLLGVLAWWIWDSSQSSPDRIYANYFQPFELALSVRNTGTSSQQKRFESAIQQYQQKAYHSAVPVLESLLEEKENTQLQIALAIALFNTGEESKAFVPLDKIIDRNDPFLTDEARWYKALFHLQLNQVQQAIPSLEILASTPGADHRADAQKILQLIK